MSKCALFLGAYHTTEIWLREVPAIRLRNISGWANHAVGRFLRKKKKGKDWKNNWKIEKNRCKIVDRWEQTKAASVYRLIEKR